MLLGTHLNSSSLVQRNDWVDDIIDLLRDVLHQFAIAVIHRLMNLDEVLSRILDHLVKLFACLLELLDVLLLICILVEVLLYCRVCLLRLLYILLSLWSIVALLPQDTYLNFIEWIILLLLCRLLIIEVVVVVPGLGRARVILRQDEH